VKRRKHAAEVVVEVAVGEQLVPPQALVKLGDPQSEAERGQHPHQHRVGPNASTHSCVSTLITRLTPLAALVQAGVHRVGRSS
jgi:hypothetical protein